MITLFDMLLEFILPKFDVLVVEGGTDGNGLFHTFLALVILFILIVISSVLLRFIHKSSRLRALSMHTRSQGSKQWQVDKLAFVFHCQWCRHQLVHVRGTLQLRHLLVLGSLKQVQQAFFPIFAAVFPFELNLRSWYD